MKKIILSVLIGISPLATKAQWAVTDAPALSQNVKNFKELQKQVGILNDQKKRLDESLDLLKKVNKTVSDLGAIQSIVNRQNDLVTRCMEIMKNPSLTSSTLSTLTNSFEIIMGNNTRLIKYARTIVSENVKMNDSERLNLLQSIEEKTREEEVKVSKVSNIVYQMERLKRQLNK